MASNDNEHELSQRQIVRLAAAISADNMTSIAEGYMDIRPEMVKNIRRDESNSEAFNRAIVRYWTNKHPENQVQVQIIKCDTLPFSFTPENILVFVGSSQILKLNFNIKLPSKFLIYLKIL